MGRDADGIWRADLVDADPPDWPAAWAGVVFAGALTAGLFAQGSGAADAVFLALACVGLACSLVLGTPGAARGAHWRRLNPLDWCVAGAAAWMILQALTVHPSPHRGAHAFLVLGGACGAYFAGRLFASRPVMARIVLPLTITVAGVFALVTLWIYFFMQSKSSGLFQDINNYAAYMALSGFALCAYMAASPSCRLPGWRRRFGIGTLFLLAAAAVGTGSRGAFLGAAAGIAMVLVIAGRNGTWRREIGIVIAALAGLGAIAILFSAAGALGKGFEGTLFGRIHDAGFSIGGQFRGRSEIWHGALALLADAPWHGIGMGTWYLRYPVFRLPADASTGFHAHNDYLELATEGGWPLLLIMLAAAYCLVRLAVACRRLPAGPDGAALSMTFLVAGIVAMLVHSALNFNLYVMPLPWLLAFIVAQLVNAAEPKVAVSATSAMPGRGLPGAGVATLAGAGIMVIAAAFAVCNMQGVLYEERGRAAFVARDFSASTANLAVAQAWSPFNDVVTITRADLLFKQAVGAAPTERRQMLDEVTALLDRADAFNPFAPYTPLLRGHIVLIDSRGPALLRVPTVEALYRRAIARDPYHTEAIYSLARLLMDAGRDSEAAGVMRAAPLTYRGVPVDENAHFNLAAHAYARAGMKEEGLKAAQRAAAARTDGRGEAYVTAYRRKYGIE